MFFIDAPENRNYDSFHPNKVLVNLEKNEDENLVLNGFICSYTAKFATIAQHISYFSFKL